MFSRTTNRPSSHISKLKDRRRPEDKKNVVYKTSCNICSFVYIGESGQSAKQQMVEHKTAVKIKEENSHIHRNNRGT